MGDQTANCADACHRFLTEIHRFRENRQSPLVVALDGPSGAGKSTLARQIAREIEVALVNVDDFFAADIPDQHWDRFSVAEKLERVFDWGRIRAEAVEPLRAGRPARWHPFDFESGLRADGTYGMLPEPVTVKPAPLILLDDAYSAGPQLADLVDLAVLVDAPIEERHARLAAREEAEFLKKWHAHWDPVEGYYFRQVRSPESFDLVIRLDF